MKNPDLRATLTTLAETFARGVLDAIRRTPVEELLSSTTRLRSPRREAPAPTTTPAPSRGRAAGGRRRRAPGDIDKTTEALVATLKEAKTGMRSEELRAKLGIARAVLQRATGKAIEAKRVRKTGEKRATTYFAT
jgi:hypothetical protein